MFVSPSRSFVLGADPSSSPLPRSQDLGNTNYCVFVPREQFERRTNAELVARALNEVKIPASVNKRNDICVEGFKMSLC